MSYSEEEVDRCIAQFECAASRALAVSSTGEVSLKAAETDLLKEVEHVRDVLERAIAGDRSTLRGVFGPDTCHGVTRGSPNQSERLGRCRRVVALANSMSECSIDDTRWEHVEVRMTTIENLLKEEGAFFKSLSDSSPAHLKSQYSSCDNTPQHYFIGENDADNNAGESPENQRGPFGLNGMEESSLCMGVDLGPAFETRHLVEASAMSTTHVDIATPRPASLWDTVSHQRSTPLPEMRESFREVEIRTLESAAAQAAKLAETTRPQPETQEPQQPEAEAWSWPAAYFSAVGGDMQLSDDGRDAAVAGSALGKGWALLQDVTLSAGTPGASGGVAEFAFQLQSVEGGMSHASYGITGSSPPGSDLRDSSWIAVAGGNGALWVEGERRGQVQGLQGGIRPGRRVYFHVDAGAGLVYARVSGGQWVEVLRDPERFAGRVWYPGVLVGKGVTVRAAGCIKA